MKKITIIFTLVLIAFFSVGNFLIFSCYVASYQNSYQAFVKNHSSQLSTTNIFINPSQLYIDSQDLLWEDDDKEVLIKGVLYDVVSITHDKGKAILTVLSDEQEQDIKTQFSSIFDTQDNAKSSAPVKLLKQFVALKYVNDFTKINYQNQNECFLLSFTEYSFSIKPVFLNREAMPPNLLG